MSSKEKFIPYAQFITISLLIIWIIIGGYIAYVAPRYSDERNGRIHSVTYKSDTVFLTLIELILIYGSTVGWVVSGAALAFLSYSSKDEKE